MVICSSFSFYIFSEGIVVERNLFVKERAAC
jgi:hypothetical protein